MADNKGFVYVMTNPSMEGLVKVGLSSRVPTERAEDLYTTGIPTPFVVEYFAFFDDMFKAERLAHQNLSSFRHGKEFFRTDVGTAIHAIESTGIPFKRLFSKPEDERRAAEVKAQWSHSVIGKSLLCLSKFLVKYLTKFSAALVKGLFEGVLALLRTKPARRRDAKTENLILVLTMMVILGAILSSRNSPKITPVVTGVTGDKAMEASLTERSHPSNKPHNASVADTGDMPAHPRNDLRTATSSTPDDIRQIAMTSARGDENNVRQRISVLDAQPKPLHGDRKAARKINSQGLSLFQAGSYSEAAAAFKAGTYLDPGDAEIANNYGQALLMAGRLDEARRVLVDVLIHWPTRGSAGLAWAKSTLSKVTNRQLLELC